MSTWYNADGLFIKFGTAEGWSAHEGGVYNAVGPHRVVELVIDLPKLGSSAAVINDVIMVPAGYKIEQVDVITLTGATSANNSATLTVGFKKLDRTTELDHDGVLATLARSNIDADNEHVVLRAGDSGGEGALVGGAPLSEAGLFCANYGTEAFTAGKVKLRVTFSV